MRNLMDEANEILKSLSKEEIVEKAGSIQLFKNRLAGHKRQLDDERSFVEIV